MSEHYGPYIYEVIFLTYSYIRIFFFLCQVLFSVFTKWGLCIVYSLYDLNTNKGDNRFSVLMVVNQ